MNPDVPLRDFRAFVTRWRWVLCGFVSLELLKLAGLLLAGQNQPWGDSPTYWHLGGEAARGDWWLTTSALASRTPGYPWFLALCLLLFQDHALLAVVSMQHGTVLMTSLATVWLTWQVSRKQGLALVAAGWCVLATARPLYANWILTESLATCALTLFTLTLWYAREWKHPVGWLAAGIMLGLGILIRPALLAAVPMLLIASFWEFRQSERTILNAFRAFAGMLVMFVVLIPWCLRNWFLFDRFALTIFTGRQLWKAAFDPWPGGGLPLPQDGPAAVLRSRIPTSGIDLRHNWSVAAALSHSGLADHELDLLMEQVAWQAIARNPGQALGRLVVRCMTFWYVREWAPPAAKPPGPQDPFHDQRQLALSPWQPRLENLLRFTPERCFPAIWLWSGMTWLGALFLVFHPDQRRWGVLLVVLFGSTTLLTAALEVPVYRYRAILEPLMIVATLCGTAEGLARLRKCFLPKSKLITGKIAPFR